MRPTILHVGGVLYWVIRTRDPDTQLLKDADATPTVVIVKNGTVTGDSVTITKRSATTGIYDCSYNPAGEVEGDDFTVEESAQVTGTTTAQATYSNSWAFGVVALERGTDGANTTTPLDAAGTRSAVGLASANLDTQLADLPTVAEFDARSLPSADYFVVSDYTTPPTASSVADEVQTRTIARVTLVDTCTTNTDMRGTDNALLASGYTAPPTASANASQVRTELSTELARIDATVSSRSTLTAANVWEHATRSLTTFGTLVSDIWSAGTRTLTAISDSSGITTLLGRIAGNIRTSADDVTAETAQTTAVRSGLALEATLDAAETAILAAIDGIEGSGLTGDYTLTVTVTDATDDEPIEAATVTLFRSGERGVEPTDDEGEAVFGVDAATWSYVVRAAGYESATGTKVIAANDTLAVELTPIVVVQAEAPLCNVLLPIIDQYMSPASGVLVCIEFLYYLNGATKTAIVLNHPPSIRSDSEGLVEVTLARLARYRATYQIPSESPKRVEFSTPNAGSFTVVEA